MLVKSDESNKRIEFSKSNWEANYNNKNISGIEFKDASGNIVHFVVIENKSNPQQINNEQQLCKDKAFRSVVQISEDGRPILPEKQTFDQLIQEKRRLQAILYNNSTSSAATTASTLTHRRAVNAVRRIARQTALKKSLKTTKKSTSASSSKSGSISLKTSDQKKKFYNKVDPKIAKALIRSAPAGSTVTLPDGTLIKKSRRGGARPGAGRRRKY